MLPYEKAGMWEQSSWYSGLRPAIFCCSISETPHPHLALSGLLFPALTLLYLPLCLRRQRNHSQSLKWQMVIKLKNSQAGFWAWPQSCRSSWRYIFNVNIPGNMSLGLLPGKLLGGLFSPCVLCISFSFLELFLLFRNKLGFMIPKAVSNLMTFPKPRLKGHKTCFRELVETFRKQLLV